MGRRKRTFGKIVFEILLTEEKIQIGRMMKGDQEISLWRFCHEVKLDLLPQILQNERELHKKMLIGAHTRDILCIMFLRSLL